VSGEATGYVFRHSTAKGAAFAVHLAIADIANDTHEYRVWVPARALAEKARVNRVTASRSVRWLTENGYLTRLTPEGNPGRNAAVEYRFLMPDPGGACSERLQGACSERLQPLYNQATTKEQDLERKGTKESGTVSDEEVERLCTLLAGLVEDGGDPRPTVTKAWREECDRMIRLDRRSPAEIEAVMRWATADAFWGGIISTPKKLRAKFPILRRQVKRAMPEDVAWGRKLT